MKRLMGGWGRNRNTVPLRNTLANRAASKMTKNQIMALLTVDPVLLKNVTRALEHRAKNLQNENMRLFMRNYYLKKINNKKRKRNG